MWRRVDLVWTYRFHLEDRKIRERGTSMSRWLQLIQLFHLQESYTGSDLLSATCSPISTDPSPLLSIDFPFGPLFLPTSSYIAWCFRLVAQSAATCSRWFLARGFFYPEDGGDTFLRNFVQTRYTQLHISEDGILLKPYYISWNIFIMRLSHKELNV
jgi:hypothetical protein